MKVAMALLRRKVSDFKRILFSFERDETAFAAHFPGCSNSFCARQFRISAA
jgi:hypothetical protein